MLVYFLDAPAATLSLVEIDAGAFQAECRRLLGCETVDEIELGDGHTAHFDDYALGRPARALWSVQRKGAPMIAGNAVICGSNGPDGCSVPPGSPRDLANSLRVFRPVIVADFVRGYDPRTFTGITMLAGAGVGEFRLTLEEGPVLFEERY